MGTLLARMNTASMPPLRGIWCHLEMGEAWSIAYNCVLVGKGLHVVVLTATHGYLQSCTQKAVIAGAADTPDTTAQ